MKLFLCSTRSKGTRVSRSNTKGNSPAIAPDERELLEDDLEEAASSLAALAAPLLLLLLLDFPPLGKTALLEVPDERVGDKEVVVACVGVIVVNWVTTTTSSSDVEDDDDDVGISG